MKYGKARVQKARPLDFALHDGSEVSSAPRPGRGLGENIRISIVSEVQPAAQSPGGRAIASALSPCSDLPADGRRCWFAAGSGGMMPIYPTYSSYPADAERAYLVVLQSCG